MFKDVCQRFKQCFPERCVVSDSGKGIKGIKQTSMILIVMLSAFILVTACSQANENQTEAVAPPEATEHNAPEIVEPDNSDVQPEDETGRSVFFAHNSVGQNIIDGIRALELVPILNDQQIGEAGVAEVYMGFNGDPAGKIDAFAELMDNGGNKAQIAFFKLCYSDFEEGTDAAALFDKYSSVLAKLEEKYPGVAFVHVTAPLYDYNASWHNAGRHAFNEKMRAQYGDRVFDLAEIESVDASGNKALSRDGVTPALSDDWSSDGGHLNDEGGKHMASELISFLANVPLK